MMIYIYFLHVRSHGNVYWKPFRFTGARNMFYILLADVSKLLVQTGIQFCCMFFFTASLCSSSCRTAAMCECLCQHEKCKTHVVMRLKHQRRGQSERSATFPLERLGAQGVWFNFAAVEIADRG